MREAKRYLGLELAGAKNQKTAIAALEYYPREGKIFLLDIFDKIVPSAEHTTTGSDEGLLELIGELTEDIRPGGAVMGVNVPLELPPCIECTKKKCPLSQKCSVAAVKWMREFTRRSSRSGEVKVREFTPYTQRPVELWLRYQVLPRLDSVEGMEVDETLGGNRAPLTARMNFLKRHLRHLELLEVWPKLSTLILARQAGVSKRTVSTYRRLEEGLQAREEILETLADAHNIFIYDRDIRKLAHSLASFDAFICAYTALLSDLGKCEKAPAGFPLDSGWIQYPKREKAS